jgi:hypothetical protein
VVARHNGNFLKLNIGAFFSSPVYTWCSPFFISLGNFDDNFVHIVSEAYQKYSQKWSVKSKPQGPKPSWLTLAIPLVSSIILNRNWCLNALKKKKSEYSITSCASLILLTAYYVNVSPSLIAMPSVEIL